MEFLCCRNCLYCTKLYLDNTFHYIGNTHNNFVIYHTAFVDALNMNLEQLKPLR